MRLLFIGIWIISGSLAGRRWRRQALPSQHVQVSSLDSNVLYNDEIYVESTENRIDVKERTLNGSIWSDHSLLNFDSLDTFANVTADNAESYFSLSDRANLHGQGITSKVYLHTNRTQNGNSAMSHSLSGSANFSIEDEALRVQAVNGRKIGVEAETWQRQVELKMTLNVETTKTHDRELKLEALSNAYHVLATYSGSTMFISFANKIMRLGNDYRNVEIFTDKFNVTVITRDVSYDITLTQEEVIINLPTQRTRVCLTLDGVSVKSNQAAKTRVDRNDGNMTIGGKSIDSDGATLMAGTTSLNLTNAGQITADLTNSRFIIDNNIQKVGLVSAHQMMEIDQGFPKITVDPGESCVEIVANRGLPQFADIIPPFKWPQDKFKNIGPFEGNVEKEYEFYNKPSCCSAGGATSGPLPETNTGHSEWSEWGNNGNNGGSLLGGGPDRLGGTILRTTRTREPVTPVFGHWPTLNSVDEPVTRKKWSDSFVTRTTSGNWENEIGCNCRSTPELAGATKPSSLSTNEVDTDTISTEAVLPSSKSATETETTESLQTTPPTVPRSAETTEILVTVSFEPSTETVFQTEATIQVSDAGTTEESTAATTGQTQSENFPATTKMIPIPNTFPTLTTNFSEEEGQGQNTTPEDFLIAQYASTLFPLPEAIPLNTTISSIEVSNNQQPDGFPPPNVLGPQPENTTEGLEWSGGASDLDTSTDPADGFPFPFANNWTFVKRSPLVLTLRLPDNVVGRQMNITDTIREGLRRVIRRASKRKIAKRQIPHADELIQISSIRQNNGTMEIVFDVVESPIIEDDLLSLSNQEMSEYFDYPVISLTRVEEFGDNRLIYILVAFGAAVMSFFCLCCIFQSLIKQMSQSLLVSVGKRFHKQPLSENNQDLYQNANAPY